jgi:uncharacterized membrane protein YccC
MIHQAKSNPQLLDEQIFSERLASALSAIGTFETSRRRLRMSVHRGRLEVIGTSFVQTEYRRRSRKSAIRGVASVRDVS